MTEKQAHRTAARLSKTEGAQYVVWVFDDGRYVYDASQARRNAPFIHVEATYIDGVKVAGEHAVA